MKYMPCPYLTYDYMYYYTLSLYTLTFVDVHDLIVDH